MRFDELNTPITTYEYVDFQKYFAPMQITEEQKEKRTETAHDLFFDFLMLFALIQQSIEDGDLDYLFILQQFQDMYADTVSKYARTDDYTREYVDSFTRETMDTTWSHLDLSEEQNYWLSNDRASILALNESNSINNYEDLMKAVDEGYTHKTWKAEIDSRTRKDHIKMDGKTIEIDRYFEFPDCMMLFPHDEVNGTAKQCANCRCSVKYSNGKPKIEKALNYELGDETVSITESIPIVRGSTEYYNETYEAQPILNSPNNLYMTKKFDRDTNEDYVIERIEGYISKSLDILGTNGKTIPRFVLVSDTELPMNVGGRYNPVTNTVYYKKIVDDPQLQKELVYHELVHWNDAQEYIMHGGVITTQDTFEEIMNARAKVMLDRLCVNADNVGVISSYAKRTYEKIPLETYTEYRVMKTVGGKKDAFIDAGIKI